MSPENYYNQTDDGIGTEYKYDLNDRLIKITNALGYTVQENEYDIDGELISQIINGSKVYFTLDIVKRRTQITTQISKKLGKISREVEYDALDNIIGVTDGEENHTRYYLDNWGRIR